MAIIESNIKLLASERMTDESDGGGFMTGSIVADGVENNLFPDISDADRTFGRVQLRKVYAAVTSTDADTFLGAHAILDQPPGDPAVSALMVTKAGYTQKRSDIVAALNSSSYKVAPDATKRILGGAVLTATVTSSIQARYNPPYHTSYWDGTSYVSGITGGEIKPGDILGLFTANAADAIPSASLMEAVYVGSVATEIGYTGGGVMASITLTRPVQASYNANTDVSYNIYASTGYNTAPDPSNWAVKLTQDTTNGALTFYGQTTTTAGLSVNATTIPITSSFAQYIPVGDGVYPTVDPGILGVDPAPFSNTGGRVQIFRKDEAVVIHHTISEAPQTVTNGQDIDLGRTRLAKVQVFGNDGNEITTGFAVNKTTGHIVFSSVAGYSQPVTIKHRIEDMLLVTVAGEQQLTVLRGVTHAFPSGSKVSSVMMFGDMQAKVHDGLAQATWTGAWSDSLIGSAPTADFYEALHPIVVNNAGAITERWAVIFTNSTSFKVIGEQVGEVVPSSAGNTGSNCAPLNPATGQPFFTIPATGWGTGWAAGNVFRFNTDGANAPIWLIRSIAPSDPFVGQDKFTVALRGNVNA